MAESEKNNSSSVESRNQGMSRFYQEELTNASERLVKIRI